MTWTIAVALGFSFMGFGVLFAHHLGANLPSWGLGAKKDQGRELNPGNELTETELGKYYLLLSPPPVRVVLGEHHRFQHTQIIGASGVGKNYYALLPMIYQDIRRGAGVIVLDPKGAMRNQVAAYAREVGRLSHAHFLSLSRPELSDTYSSFTDPDPHKVAEGFYEAFYQDDATPTPFYREQAKGFLLNLFTLFHKMDVLPTLDQIRTIAMDQNALKMLLGQAPDCREARETRVQLVDSLDSVEYTKVFQGMTNKLTALCGSKFAPLLNTTSPSINIADVVAKGEILYVDLAADMYPSSYRRVSTMLMMDLQSSLTLRYNKAVKPVFLYMDEFADLVYPQVRALIAKAREASVGVTYAHQSLGDLEQYGKAIAQGIFESSSNKVIFRVGSPETAEMLAKLAGTETVKRDVVNYSLQGGIGPMPGSKEAKGLTQVQEEQFLFHPNDLKNLGVGEALVIVQRQRGRDLYRTKMLSAPPNIPPLKDDQLHKPKEGHRYTALELNSGRRLTVPGEKIGAIRTPLQQNTIGSLKQLGQKMGSKSKHG